MIGMKSMLLFTFLFLLTLAAQAQDAVQNRILFIGDGGSINKVQKELIYSASNKVISGKTSVVYLGNNIYPDGFGSQPKEKNSPEGKILQSQYLPMRKKGAKVYFLPGNRDWDDKGPHGLTKIQKEWTYFEYHKDSLLKLLPPDGCPDPVVIPVSDSLVMIALDTEWWLYQHDKENSEDDCSCTSQRDVIDALREYLYKNGNKTVLLIMHHPFMSYGKYGGYHSWKDHIFPLLHVNPSLYLPLPGIGSFYPLFNKAFPGIEYLKHPLYKSMIRNISKVLQGFPNLILISSHDNGQQLIENKKTHQTQIVTGIGRGDDSYIKNGKKAVFTSEKPGYVVADQLPGNQIHFTFYSYQNGKVEQSFQYTMGYEQRSHWKDSIYTPIPKDSIVTAVNPSYNKIGKFGRFWLGDNYRKAWAAPVKLPVFHLDTLHGGLHTVKLGGGMQTTTLRLADSNGVEYNMRSVDKAVGKLVPAPFRGTFVRGLMKDATSAQFPYGALMVPPVEDAVGVPHLDPSIGVVAPDSLLGAYQKLAVGKVFLLDKREPYGNTDNYKKAFKKLQKDNDNSFDAINFLKARMVDLLFGDWDRHGDQWRFYDLKKGSHKFYSIMPRDRDIVLNVTQGVIPFLVKNFFIMPHASGFGKELLPGSNFYLMKSSFLNAYPANQISYKKWMQTAQEFESQVTDSVLKASVSTLPKGLDTSQTTEILTDLEARRDQIPEAMDKYYKLVNHIVDIRGSDRKELVKITDVKGKDALHIMMQKIDKHGNLEDTLMEKTYPRSMTKEIRIYLGEDKDKVSINNKTSSIKLRIIGGKPRHQSHKTYQVINSKNKINIYDYKPETYLGKTKKIKKHISSLPQNTQFVPVNLYNTYLPLVTGAINLDDGVMLGLGIQYKKQGGFRKTPYASLHKLTVMHSFTTQAFEIKYKGEWRHVFGHTDILLKGDAKAPKNIQNFFGIGNETPIDKSGDYKRFYRTRFNVYHLNAAFRWHWGEHSTFSVGPEVQYYHLNPKENQGRFIHQKNKLHSYDSAVIAKDKWHLGLKIKYKLDHRNNEILPTYGYYLNIDLKGLVGLSRYADAFAQLNPNFAFYKNLNETQSVILADRIGGSFTIGKPSFYQYAYLGGQGNLLGFRKFRFAGLQSVYNNLEMRIRLADFGNQVMRGEIGLTGFYDIGRVWSEGTHSRMWHQGVGGGIYLAPASLAVLRFDLGYSKEGWYPYFGFGIRF